MKTECIYDRHYGVLGVARKVGFESPLQIEPIARRRFKILVPLVYVDERGKVWVVPAGRVTDLASTWGIPIVATAFDGIAPMSAVLHDMLYDGEYEGEIITRKQADDLFYEAMAWENAWYHLHGEEDDAIHPIVRRAMHEGVKLGGAQFFRGTQDGYISDEAKECQDAMFGR